MLSVWKITFSLGERFQAIFRLTKRVTVLFFTVGNGGLPDGCEIPDPTNEILNLRKEPPFEIT